MYKRTDIATDSLTVYKKRCRFSAVCSIALLVVFTSYALAEPRGLIVQVGGSCPAPGEGRVIHYLLADDAAVDEARNKFRSQDSVQVDLFAGKQLPHAENTVCRLICEIPGALQREEVMRVLRPLGTARLRTVRGWSEITKRWPDDVDQWTHWLHGPGGNPVAADRRVGPPRRMLWTATPRRARSHEKSPSLTGMVTALGRIFYINDEAPISLGGPLPDKWRIVARDAFSGTLLWKRSVPDWGWQAWSPSNPMNLRWGNPRFIHRRLVAVGDRVYVTLGYSAPVSVLDARSGRTLRTLAGTEYTSEIVYHDGLLVLSVARDDKRFTDKVPPLSIAAVDALTGAVRWRSDPLPSLGDLSERGKKAVLKQGRLMIAAGDDLVVAVSTEEIVAHELASGNVLWRRPRPGLSAESSKKGKRPPVLGSHHLGMLVLHRGRVYFGQPHARGKMNGLFRMTLLCLSADTGKELWKRIARDFTYTNNLNIYAIGDRLVVHKGVYNAPAVEILDAATGESIRTHDISAINSRHHHRCYRNKATERYLLLGKEGVECVDLETGKVTVNRWVRGTCLYGIMPANGLLYTCPASCACNQMNRLDGFTALAAAASESPEDHHPLVKGSAYGHAGADLSDNAWPQYRRDAKRSGLANLTPAAGPGWRVELGGKLTPPVSDGASLYAGRGKEVLALSCADGKVRWRVPGHIDSPPTLHRGLVIFGTRNGWVHCRRSTDGALAWRFRAAPAERLIQDDSHLESAWPLHGSVLLLGDTLYANAGRSSFLDGGIRIHSIEPVTGRLLRSAVFHTEQTLQADYYEGVNNDLLATDGRSVFLKHMRIDPKTLDVSRQGWWHFTGPDGGLKSYPKPKLRLPVDEQRVPVLSMASGFLDDELFGRGDTQLDGGESCGRICFDETRSYGVRHNQGVGHFQFHEPGKSYPVLCFDRKPKANNEQKKGKSVRGRGPLWQNMQDRVRPTALLVTKEHLLLGGGPDTVDPDDPLKSFEWRNGGLLHVMNRQDGKLVSERELPAPPVHEGLIAVESGIFVCLKDGSVMRL